jgi:molybdate transport system substrate-binding protein
LSVLKLLILTLFLTAGCAAQELKVAAAADLSSVMPRLAAAFQKQTGAHVNVSLGSSGNFFAQIQNGAPFDVFLSADRSYPEKLQAAGLTEPGTLVTYARGRLVLWMPDTSPLHFTAGKSGVLRGDLKSLPGPQVRRIAIADPEHAPYGRAAVAVLQYYGVYQNVKPKLILGENISQTAQFAQSGNADAAFIAYSIALTAPMEKRGHVVLLPQESYPPLDQAAVVPRSSRNKEQARRFLEFLKSGEAQTILRQFGFEAAPE